MVELTTLHRAASALHFSIACIVGIWALAARPFNSSIPTNLYRVAEGGKTSVRVAGEDNGYTTLLAMGMALLLFTAFCHLLYAGRGSAGNLVFGEYALSATLMTVLIAFSVGTLEFSEVCWMALANALVMLLGWCAVEATPQPGLAWNLTLLAWLPFFGIWANLFRNYANAVAGQPVPAFVHGIVATMFVFYTAFGVVHALQIRSREPGSDKHERRYIGLSFVAKSVLALLLASGLFARG
jgi:hypothetical protein